MRTRIIVLGGALACLLIAAEARPVADSTKSDAKRPRIQVSSQQVGVGNATVTQAIDVKRQGAVPPAVTDADRQDGAEVFAPEDTDSVPVYAIPWHSINSGGAFQVSGEGGGDYTANSSVAQSAAGASSNDTYEAGTGYWYGTDTTTIICVCACHADPACDSVTNVLDVVQAVNVAFRSWTPVFDPNCTYERTDADCNGFTNVIDVVKFVNVAFRGGLPVYNFCNPCP